ncbi:MAG: hypothetical protein GC178_00470 [Flavobacteriales bacterium]|nr:hypothetical protein [Flavobacteriales bacterium]
MDQETAHYIVEHYRSLMIEKEKRAQRHHFSTVKIGDEASEARQRVYQKMFWLSNDPEILALLDGGYERFEIHTASRILSEHEDEVFLNHCPKCGRLARTPKAKQCRYCGNDWHG